MLVGDVEPLRRLGSKRPARIGSFNGMKAVVSSSGSPDRVRSIFGLSGQIAGQTPIVQRLSGRLELNSVPPMIFQLREEVGYSLARNPLMGVRCASDC